MYRIFFKRMISKIGIRRVNTSNLIIDSVGQITTIGINRPSKRNCLDFETVELIKNAIKSFEEDSNAYVAVIYGTGGNFCSGFDLNELVNPEDDNKLDECHKGFLNLPTYTKKPLVAAISGYAVAGGLELALLCDLRVMEETAILGLYSRRFGIPLTDGATVRLQSMIGLSRALDMILTGRSLNAKEAFEWGLANRVVACGTALGQALNLATSLLKFPQESLKIDRDSTYNAAFNQAYEELLKYEREHTRKLFLDGSIVQGANKFISGLGKHGKTYNLTKKKVCDWEQEFADDNTKPKSKL